MPIVEIILPAYNAARFLPMALDSVIAQTFSDWRILLVDDGSVDETAQIAARYAEQLGSRLSYIHQENRGLAAARNTAIRHATAPFLALLDADDVWLPRRLERSLGSFGEDPEIGLSYGLVEGIDLNGELRARMTVGAYPAGWVAGKIYRRSMDLPCPTITFRRVVLDTAGVFDETLRASEDRDLWLRIAQRYRVACVPEIIAQYRTSPQSMTTDPDRMLAAQLHFVDKHFGSPGCGFWSRRVALSGIYRQRAEALGNLGLRRKAVLTGLRALLLHPFGGKNVRTTMGLFRRWVLAT